METKYYNKGDVIIEEGASDKNAYIILMGEVVVYMKNQKLATLEENQIFGEIGLIDGRERTASCVAGSDNVQVGVISPNNYDKLFRENPKVLLPILKILTDRLRSTIGFIEKLTTL